MHIDHNQFLQLITDTSGIDADKVEKQLLELLSEIRQSVADDEAYEIEGFGIFSSLGNRIMFIPSKELETEINFKYVGMEPIELDEPTPSFDDPFDGLDQEGDTAQKKPSVDQRFAGLIDDLGEQPEEEETPGPEEWGVEAHKEDESADRLFASLMGEEYTPPIKEEEGIDASETDDFDEFGDIFADKEDTDLGAEVASFMDNEEPEETSEPDADDELEELFGDSPEDEFEEDIFAEEPEEAEGSEIAEEEHTEEEIEEVDPDSELDSPEEVVDEAESEEEEPEEDLDKESPELEQADEFDDPFLSLEDDQVDESILRLEELDDTEIVPVIRNISTEVPEEEVAEPKEKKDKPKKEKKKKEKPAKEKSEAQPAPAWMWVLLIVVVAGGGIAGLGYFNVINIPFISTQTTTETSPQPIQAPPPAPVAQSQVTEAQTTTPEEPATETVEPQTEEQSTTPQVPVQEVTDNPVSSSADQYGLTGMLSESGNDGYTIILYTLSNQQNAINERQRLIDNGYRGFLTPVPSERYGTLFRVSVGQFATLYDAAVAAEQIEYLLPDNYIIKKIN